MNTRIQTISGRVIPLRGNDIDTDRIIPARYLRCVTFEGLGAHVFEDDRRQNAQHPFSQERYQGATILVAGRNFGCGSSREHAPQALNRWGVRAVVAESFAEIFFGNCLALGIPCLTLSAANVAALWKAVEDDPAQEFTLDVAAAQLRAGEKTVQGEIPKGVQEALLTGAWNGTMVLLEAEGDIMRLAATGLPYLRNFA